MWIKENWKRYIQIGMLFLMTAWMLRIGNEKGADSLQEVQSKQNPQSGQESAPLGTGSIPFGSVINHGNLLGRLILRKPILEAPPESEAQNREPEAQSSTVELSAEDANLYAQCLRNLHQGNNIVYADGYYYFRSQAQNYSLCRSKGAGMPVEVIADQVPGAIYVTDDQIYFINVSDNRTLYLVGTDGSGLRQLSDFPMQELVVVGDRIYFRSVYDREHDPFYLMLEDDAEDDRYLYSMKMDGSDRRLLIPQLCLDFTTDGNRLYYVVYDTVHDATQNYVLYGNNLDGTHEEKLFQCENRIWDLLFWQEHIYWMDSEKEQLMRLKNVRGEKETLASDAWRFSISDDGRAYVINAEEIREINLATGADRLLIKKEDVFRNNDQETEDRIPWHYGGDNKGLFLVNGLLFVKYFESKEKGILWHVWDEQKNAFTLFEDMEPLAAETLVSDTSISLQHGELLFYYPGREDDETKKYLDAENEFCYESSYEIGENGRSYGNFRIALPRFNSGLASYARLNQQMEGLTELALEDRDAFFQKISQQSKREDPGWACNWHLYHGYEHCYISEKYVSLYYYRRSYEGGMREWMEPLPLIFDRETGKLLQMDDLFTVERKFYMKRLTGAIYKYSEMNGYDWSEPFDNNILTKMLGNRRCYLTPDGIVFCYERYEIAAGASGSPTFEIPYEWFEDIFRQ